MNLLNRLDKLEKLIAPMEKKVVMIVSLNPLLNNGDSHAWVSLGGPEAREFDTVEEARLAFPGADVDFPCTDMETVLLLLRVSRGDLPLV